MYYSLLRYFIKQQLRYTANLNEICWFFQVLYGACNNETHKSLIFVHRSKVIDVIITVIHCENTEYKCLTIED
jgi:hypothetical protein